MNRQSFIISLRVQVVVSCLLSSFFFLSENGYASEQVTFIETIETPTVNATATVRGRVVDTNGEPLIGATIREKGGANGTVSDIDGSFFLSVPDNAILQVSLNPLLSNVVTSQRLLTSSLTAGQVIKAVSSLVGPEIVLLAVAHFGDDKWYYCFPILGFITLLSAVWLMATPVKREDSTAATQQISISDTFSLLKDKTILLLFLGIFFIVGVDVATNFISSKLMAERFDWTTEQVKFAPQVYFLSRTVGALLGAFLLARIAEIKYFRVNIVACIFSLLILAFVKNDMVNLICIGAVGFFASSVFSIIYSMALQARPEKANQISGLMITAVAGGGVVTPVIGFAIGTVGVIGGVFVTLACVCYLTYCAFWVKTAKA